jgi:hypothetical protein
MLDNTTFVGGNAGLIFDDGYRLIQICQTRILQIIKETMETNFNNYKYFVTTRGGHSYSYFIVVTLVQEPIKI